MRCKLETPAGAICVHCVHLYTLRRGLNAVIAGGRDGAPELDRAAAIRSEESELAGRFVNDCPEPSLVLGDFNLVDDSQVYARDWQDWQNAFSRRGFGLGYTFSASQIRLRIDHILADRAHWHIRSCRVGPELGGQHRPVIAELVLLGKGEE